MSEQNESWEDITKRIIGDQAADPIVEKEEKAMAKEEARAKFSLGATVFVAAFFVSVLYLAISTATIMGMTAVLADEEILDFGFSFSSSVYAALLVALFAGVTKRLIR